MTGELPANAALAAGGVEGGVALLMAAFMSEKSSTGATV
jgi:hypothetical protein